MAIESVDNATKALPVERKEPEQPKQRETEERAQVEQTAEQQAEVTSDPSKGQEVDVTA